MFTCTMTFIIAATLGTVGILGMHGIIAIRVLAGVCASAIMTTIIGIGGAARHGIIHGGIITTPRGVRVGVGIIRIGIIIPTLRVGEGM